jgi:hypothetical protein
MTELLRSLLLAIAPPIATEVTRHLLEQRKRGEEPTVRPDEPAPTFAAYVRRHKP